MRRHDYTRIAGEASVDPRTAQRAYAGRTTASTTYARIVEAAARLGYPPPPSPAAPITEPPEAA